MNSARQRYAPVKTLMLYLTEDCNLRCTYCFVEKKPRRMTSETAREAVDFLLSQHVSGLEKHLNITFFGGEPFLELDLMEEVISYARSQTRALNNKKTVHFSITTNGTVFSERVEKIIKDCNMTLLVSVDGGAQATTHRPFVSGRTSWQHIRRNLPRLLHCSSNAIVRMTFHPESLDLVGNVREVLELGARVVALCPVIEASWRGKEEALESAYQALADWYIGEARNGQCPPVQISNGYLRTYHHHLNGGTRPARPCNVGYDLLGIDPDGNVMPCHRFLYRRHDHWGSVAQATLPADRSKYVMLHSRDFASCSGCIAEPVCSGGCPATALNRGLSLHEPHPGYCLVTRTHVRALYRIYRTLVAEQNRAFLALLGSQVPDMRIAKELVTT